MKEGIIRMARGGGNVEQVMIICVNMGIWEYLLSRFRTFKEEKDNSKHCI